MQAEVAELADAPGSGPGGGNTVGAVSYTHLRAHETKANLVCRLLEKTELLLEIKQRVRLNISLRIAVEYLLLALASPLEESNLKV